MKLEAYVERQYIKITVYKMYRNYIKISQVRSSKLKVTLYKRRLYVAVFRK